MPITPPSAMPAIPYIFLIIELLLVNGGAWMARTTMPWRPTLKFRWRQMPDLWTPANHSIVIFMLTRRKREAARRNAISQPLFLLGVAFRVVDYRLTRN